MTPEKSTFLNTQIDQLDTSITYILDDLDFSQSEYPEARRVLVSMQVDFLLAIIAAKIGFDQKVELPAGINLQDLATDHVSVDRYFSRPVYQRGELWQELHDVYILFIQLFFALVFDEPESQATTHEPWKNVRRKATNLPEEARPEKIEALDALATNVIRYHQIFSWN